MKARARRRRSTDGRLAVPRVRPVLDGAPRGEQSPTAVAVEAIRTGVLPLRVPERRAPASEEAIRVGDPDDDIMGNEYVGEETPGASTPTPDQNMVDEIGRAYGLQEEDTGALQSGADVLARRDRHRGELQPPRRPQS